MAVVVDDVDRAGVYARSPQGRRVQPAATNRHSHTSTRRWCVGGLAVKQDAYDRSRDFPAQSLVLAETRDDFLFRSAYLGPCPTYGSATSAFGSRTSSGRSSSTQRCSTWRRSIVEGMRKASTSCSETAALANGWN